MNVIEALSYLLAAILIFNKQITIGDFAAYYLYLKVFYKPINYTITQINSIINHSANFESYNNFLKLEEESNLNNQELIDNIQGRLSIKDLSFSYNNIDNVLNDISIDIKQGETVAFVGESGCGKTTLCKLLYKFYDYDKGSITIDGKELKNLNPHSYRKNIGVVQQESFMFATSIKDNILYGKLDATFEEVVEAAKKAQIHDFIMTLPDNYDTFVGERGLKLSGGQRQRIAIARVFLKNPSLVILDEATSALDNITEKEIQKALDDLTKDRTCIVVAHRLTTIKNADNIFVFDKGSIVENGTHEELLNKKSAYYRLHNSSKEIEYA